MYELKQELKAYGHQIHHNVLMMSLAICRRTTLHLPTTKFGGMWAGIRCSQTRRCRR